MRFKTLWLRLFLHFGMVLVLFGVLVTLAQQIFLTTIQLNSTKELLSNTAKNIVRQIDNKHLKPDDIESKQNEELLDILDEQAAISNVQIIIYKGDTVFYPYDNADFTSITNTKTSDSDSYGTFYEKAGEEKRLGISYLVYVRNIYQDFGGYKLEVRTHLTTIHQSIDVTNVFTRIVSIAAIFLSLIWAFLFSRIFTKPIVSMNKLTYELANLNFDHKLELERSDELGQLAENINLMSDKLKTSMDELKIKNEQLTRDLEREKSLEIMRKKFVSDVSHELKTPLSIIQGYAESLKSSVSKSTEKREYYCDVIMDETTKMTKLVHDLLNLSLYTSGTFSIDPSTFKIEELVHTVTDRYFTIIGQKEINLETHIEPYEIFADPLRIEQVVNNYLNNAISHTDENCQMVVIGKVLDNDFYRVSVFNSGNPIAADDLEKVWIAFYKSDKARNRSEGRYGIGLSIVKAIMDLHNGRCGVNNVPYGVEFYCDIPINKKT